jgi:hypothetical protein
LFIHYSLRPTIDEHLQMGCTFNEINTLSKMHLDWSRNMNSELKKGEPNVRVIWESLIDEILSF